MFTEQVINLVPSLHDSVVALQNSWTHSEWICGKKRMFVDENAVICILDQKIDTALM